MSNRMFHFRAAAKISQWMGVMAAVCLLSAGMHAQRVLLLEDVFRQLRQNHPAVLRADLLNDAARAELLKARGGFDVKLYGDYQSKIFRDKTYFSVGEYGVKLPTWGGVELKSGYNTATGNFLNPENSLPLAGQAIAGFDWTLGRGLLIDARRAALQQAKIGLQLAENERLIELNDLFFNAAQLYWSWVTAREQALILANSLERARERFEGIRQNYWQGDKPAIDTLEAFILVQTRQFELAEKQQEARQLALLLNNFLWQQPPDPASFQDIVPAPPLPRVTALLLSGDELSQMNQLMRLRHPALRAAMLKLDGLEVERRLLSENRKPQLDISYNFLGAGFAFFPENQGLANAFGNNVKFGVSFSYPIPNRKARGEYQKTQVRIASAVAELDLKARELDNKLRVHANDLNTFAEQIERYNSITDNYRRMLEAEQIKFSIGESNVFFINAREQKLLEAQLKLAKLMGEYQKALIAVEWARGELVNRN